MKIWSDESLVRYLDGQLNIEQCRELEIQMMTDSELATRLKVLSVDTAAIRTAFETTLIKAPAIQIAEPDEQHFVQTVVEKPSPSMRQMPIVASVLIALGLGTLIGLNFNPYLNPFLNSSNSGVSHSAAAWQQAVVDYQVLYVPKTLPPTAPTEKAKTNQLAAVSESSGLTVTANMVALPGIEFRRAQTLGLNGSPLIQMAFAGPDGQPIALCFTPVMAAASEPVEQVIDGMNTVSWRNGEFGFIIVGFADAHVLKRAADKARTLFKNT